MTIVNVGLSHRITPAEILEKLAVPSAEQGSVLARLHAGMALDTRYLASLGHGGLLGREAAWRIPPYEAALEADDDDL